MITGWKNQLLYRLSQKNYVVIVGAQKAGTTSLYNALESHSDVMRSTQKEQHFFDFYQPTKRRGLDYIRDPLNRYDYAGYEANWFDEGESTYIDATPIYCWWRGCLKKIRRYRRDAKVIMVLRDPVDRAISQYKMEVGRGYEDRTLSQVCNDFNKKVNGKQHRVDSYIERGYYRSQLDEIHRLFKKVMILKFNDLINEPDKVLTFIQGFIGLKQERLILPHEMKGPNVSILPSEVDMVKYFYNL